MYVYIYIYIYTHTYMYICIHTYITRFKKKKHSVQEQIRGSNP
jgi:hypothetical protein